MSDCGTCVAPCPFLYDSLSQQRGLVYFFQTGGFEGSPKLKDFVTGGPVTVPKNGAAAPD